MQKKATIVPSAKIAKVVKGLSTTSAKIRYLTYHGYSNGDVARYLGIIPQFASNIRNKNVKDPIVDFPRDK